jgi:PTS system galactitol-specific IIB component
MDILANKKGEAKPMKPIKVLIVCATALATSTMAAVKLEQEFKRRGVPVKLTKGRISDMRSLIRQSNPDLVVATAVVKKDVGVPLFNGVALLSGLGLDELYAGIFEYVDQLLADS